MLNCLLPQVNFRTWKTNVNTVVGRTWDELFKRKYFYFVPDLKHAAVKIQACFRGHIERKKITEDDKAKDAEVDLDIDEITKKVAEELDIDLSDPELNKAATKIQATFRGHKTRKETDKPSE